MPGPVHSRRYLCHRDLNANAVTCNLGISVTVWVSRDRHNGLLEHLEVYSQDLHTGLVSLAVSILNTILSGLASE